MGNKYRRNGYNGAPAPYHPAIDLPVADMPTMFPEVRLTFAQKAAAVAIAYGGHALAALALFCAAALAAIMLTGCGSDPVARQIIERQADYWESDHRPIVSDVEFMAMPESQRAYFLPESTAKARRFAHNQAKAYAKE
jgi:hypothetical protein